MSMPVNTGMGTMSTRPELTSSTAIPGSIFLGRDTNTDDLFGLKPDDLGLHGAFFGASGRGKSNLLDVMARQVVLNSMDNKTSLVLIDPHGGVVTSLVRWIALYRLDRFVPVRLIDLSDPSVTLGFNPLLHRDHFDLTMLAEMLLNSVLQVWGQDDEKSTPRLRSVLFELFFALAHCDLTLCDALIFLNGEDRDSLREFYLDRLDEEGRNFWLEVHARRDRDEYLESTRSRLRPFLRSPVVQRMFSCTDRSKALDLASAMDAGEILLISLKPSPHLSHETSRLIGALLLNDIYMSGFRRRDVDVPAMVMVDEAAGFLTADTSRILEECRKFGISLSLFFQHLQQLRDAGDRIFHATLANTWIKACLGGLPPDDAELMARTMFWGSFDLQAAKPKLVRPQAVGVEKVQLAQESRNDGTSESHGVTSTRGTTHGTGTSRTDTENWSETEGETHSTSTTRSRSETDSTTQTETVGGSITETDSGGQSEGSSRSDHYGADSYFSPSDSTYSTSLGKSSGSSRATSDSWSSSTAYGHAVTHGIAETVGKATTRSTQNGGSIARGRSTSHSIHQSTGMTNSKGTSHSDTRGWSETFMPVYAPVPGDLWGLEGEIHKRAVSLANLPIKNLIVRVGTKRPKRLEVPFVGDTDVLPDRFARIRAELLRSTPWIITAKQADEQRSAFVAKRLRDAKRAKAAQAVDDMPPDPGDAFE